MLVFVLVFAAFVVAGVVAARVVLALPRPARSRLLGVLAVALGVRVILAVLLQLLGPWQITGRGAVTFDEAVVDYAARRALAGDPRSVVTLGGSLHTAWLLVAESVYRVADSLLALKLVNCLLGALLVVPVFLLARTLHSDRAAWFAAWGIALFPSAVVWSALGLREPMLALVLMVLLLLAARLSSDLPRAVGTVETAAGAAACLFVLAYTRSYMVPPMLLLLVGVCALATIRQRSLQPVVRGLLVITAAMGALLLSPHGTEVVRTTASLASPESPNIYNPLKGCSGSACGPVDQSPSSAEVVASSPKGSAADDPASSLQSIQEKGLLRAFLIAALTGRPVWRTNEYFFLLQPGVVVWWCLLPAQLIGFGSLLARRSWRLFALTATYTAMIIVFLAFSGQFVRHHFMVEPLGVVLSAVGLISALERGGRVRLALVWATVLMGAAAAASVVASLV